MPTKKKRVGFIPRSEVLELINKLSCKSNLSYSKVINILVEEALFKRGLFNTESDQINSKNVLYDMESNNKKNSFLNQEFNYNFKNKLLKKENLNFKDIKEEAFDNEIYSKFLMFLQFQERMKKRDI